MLSLIAACCSTSVVDFSVYSLASSAKLSAANAVMHGLTVLSAVRHLCSNLLSTPSPSLLLVASSHFFRFSSLTARPASAPFLCSAMSRPPAVSPSTPRGRVQCPICFMHLPSAHIQQHAAVCGLQEEKQQEEEADTAAHSLQAPRSKRRRQSQSPPESRVEARRKQTAKDRVSAQQRQQRTALMDSSVEEKQEQEEQRDSRHPRPLAFINSPPAVSPPSRALHSILPDTLTTTTQKRRRIDRAVITTYPPSSPVLGYGSDGTPGGAAGPSGAFQLKINIPSPSPPPISPAQYAHFSPLTAHPSTAPSWLSYRIAAIPPTRPEPGLSERTGALSFLTYNVWFDDVHQRTRTTALASLISSLQPDVVALQEVTPTQLSLLQRSAALYQYWQSPHPTTAPYFTLLLSKRQPIATYRIPFISQMGRDLTAMVMDVRAQDVGGREGGMRRLIVSTSHLESLWQSKERRAQQLKQTLSTLNSMAAHPHSSSSTSSSPFASSISSASSSSSSSAVSAVPSSSSLFFMGDTNLRGSECGPLITSQHFTDLYPALTASHPTNDAAGYTYDTVVNRMVAAMGRKGSRARYDRVLGKVGEGVEVASMWRAGMEPIREGVWISDHFGLVTELKVS